MDLSFYPQCNMSALGQSQQQEGEKKEQETK